VAAAGVNVTAMVQVAEAASVAPQVVDFAKSAGLAPPRVMLVMLRAALPVFESVRVCGRAVVPTLVVGKASVVGESVAMGAGGGVPVPVSVADCDGVAELSKTVIDAV